MIGLMQQLVSTLTSHGTPTTPDPRGEGLLVTDLDGQSLTPAVRLQVTELELQDFVRRNATSAAPVFPDVSPEVAAYRVLLVNLDEALTSGGTDITLAYGTVRWTSPPPRSWARPAGSDTVELEWTAQPPDAWR